MHYNQLIVHSTEAQAKLEAYEFSPLLWFEYFKVDGSKNENW